MSEGGVRVPPWSAWVSKRPTVVLHARCHPRQILDAFGASARSHTMRVTGLGEFRLKASRGIKGGALIAEVLHLGMLLPIHRVEVEASVVTPRSPDLCAVVVTCTAGVREPRVSTNVSGMLDDAVRRVEASGVPVEVAGWYATPAEALAAM